MSEQDYPLENQMDIIHVPCSAHLVFLNKDVQNGILFYECPVCHRRFMFGEYFEPQEQEQEQEQPQELEQPQEQKEGEVVANE